MTALLYSNQHELREVHQPCIITFLITNIIQDEYIRQDVGIAVVIRKKYNVLQMFNNVKLLDLRVIMMQLDLVE